jgi:hypothetical protein
MLTSGIPCLQDAVDAATFGMHIVVGGRARHVSRPHWLTRHLSRPHWLTRHLSRPHWLTRHPSSTFQPAHFPRDERICRDFSDSDSDSDRD